MGGTELGSGRNRFVRVVVVACGEEVVVIGDVLSD
jgi:hypothetical protein